MFGLFYLWHGFLLNDFKSLALPLSTYMGLAAIAYVLISLILTSLYQYVYIRKMKYKGAMLGALLGFFIYFIAFIFGVSFNQGAIHYVVVDFIWQMIEQGIGGVVIGFLYSLVTEMQKFSKQIQ